MALIRYVPVGTDEQRRAVATLMRYCGQAVEMVYGTADEGGSGAYTGLISSAMNNYFDYPAAIFNEFRSMYSIDEWESLVYNEVAAQRPVLYSGISNDGGHAFVCDGYDGDGMFHINWGWDGAGDGYFSLSVLNPYDNASPGGASSGIGFSMAQDITIFTDPHMEVQPFPVSSQSLLFLYEDIMQYSATSVLFSFSYSGPDAGEAVFDYAFGTMDADGTLHPHFMGDYNDSVMFAVNYMIMEFTPSDFQPGDSLTVYPMIRFRRSGAEWQAIPPLTTCLVVGCTAEGQFFMKPQAEPTHLQCADGAIVAGTGRLGEPCDLAAYIRNDDDRDFSGSLTLVPQYYGHIHQSDVTNDTPYVTGDKMRCGAYLKAGELGKVTFSYKPDRGGLVVFRLYNGDNNCGEFLLELTNDTLVDYSPYIENMSYLSHEGDEWYYNIEICDKAGVKMSYWIPSDSIGLKACTFFDDVQVGGIHVHRDIRDYLVALPEKGGKGWYMFKCRVPIVVDKDGTYAMESYLGEWIDGGLTEYHCVSSYTFQYNDPTAVATTKAEQTGGSYFDLQGRPLSGKPTRRGLYIRGGRKVNIR